MADRKLILAIDGGNSKNDIALVTSDGTLLASLRGPGASQEHYGVDQAMRILGEQVRALAEKAGLDADAGPIAQHTSACLAGADLPEEEVALTTALRAQGWSESAIALNDTFAVLRAGLRPDHGEPPWGAAVTCGAGINCVAVGPDGQVARYLALGPLTGDWGGGASLSSGAVWHAVRAEDGRGPETALRPAVANHFGFERASDIAVAIHKGQLARDDLLPLTRVLFEVADAGDPVARDILDRQAEEICVMAAAAMKRIDLPPDGAPVVLGGGVLEAQNELLLGMIGKRLAAVAPGAVPRVVDTRPVVGAALLGLDHIGGDDGAEHRLRQTYRLCCDRDHTGGSGHRGHHDSACPCTAGLRLRRARRPHMAAAQGRAADADRARRRGATARAVHGAGLARAVRDRRRATPDAAVPRTRARPGQDHPHVAA